MSDQNIYRMAGHLIRRLQQISTSVFAARMREAKLDLTSVQFAALDALARAPKVDQATLAGMIAYDRATIGNVVDRLERRGLVARSASDRDRRARLVSLTPEGEKMLAGVRPIVAGFQGDILTGLDPEEQAQFLALAAKSAAAGNALSRAPLVLPEKDAD